MARIGALIVLTFCGWLVTQSVPLSAQEDRFNNETSQREQAPSQEAQAVQAGSDVYHQLSVIVNRAWPAPVINPQEEEKIDKQLKVLRMVPKLVPCAGKMEAVLTKMKSAIEHYKKAEADRRNVEELKAGREENREAAKLLREVAMCLNEMRVVAPRPSGMRQRPARHPNYSAQVEQAQQQQQMPPVAPEIPGQIRQDQPRSTCPDKPLARTSWTLGNPPPNPDHVVLDIRNRFFSQYPELAQAQNKFVVFRAISPDILSHYPGLFTDNEIKYDIRNLRAACVPDCPGMEERVTAVWQAFFAENTSKPVCRQDVINYARRKIDYPMQTCIYPIRNKVLNPLPVMVYHKSFFKEIGQHIQDVQAKQPQWKTLHYGGPGWGDRWRAVNLRNTPPCSDSTKTRDEYPFASTLEGSGAASIRCVSASEQQEQSKVIGRFYAEEKLGPRDAFNVEVVNP